MARISVITAQRIQMLSALFCPPELWRGTVSRKKWTGDGSVKWSICCVISEKPSVPKCWVEGGELVGKAASLRCKSARGSTPLAYTWRRESGGPMPAAATQGKRDLCWRHDATAHQRLCVCVCVCVHVCVCWCGGRGQMVLEYSIPWEQNTMETLFFCGCCWIYSTCSWCLQEANATSKNNKYKLCLACSE